MKTHYLKYSNTMKYKKKPVIIEAIQWTGNNYEQVLDFVLNEATFTVGRLTGDELAIKTLEDGARGEALHVASKGDYIIRGVKVSITLVSLTSSQRHTTK